MPRAVRGTAGTRPGSERLPVRILLEGIPKDRFEGFDGLREIRVELQTRKGFEPATELPGLCLSWDFEVTVRPEKDGTPDFVGDAVQGRAGERFFYLSWSGTRMGHRTMFRRIKVHLKILPPDLAREALASGQRVVARVHAVARDGGPACASVPLLGGGWGLDAPVGTKLG